MKVKTDHHSKFSIQAIGRKKPEKYQGFNGIQTRDLRDTGAMFDQLSCGERSKKKNYCDDNSSLSSTTAVHI